MSYTPHHALDRPTPVSGRGRAWARRASFTVVAVAVVGGATTWSATAYWHAPGQGSGSTATSSATITLTGAGTVNGLYPGDSVTGVTVTVNNTSASAPVVLQSATGGAATISTAGSVTTGSVCDPSVVTFTATNVPSTPIAAGGHATVTGSVAMSNAAGNQCQGATFSIPVSVVAKSG